MTARQSSASRRDAAPGAAPLSTPGARAQIQCRQRPSAAGHAAPSPEHTVADSQDRRGPVVRVERTVLGWRSVRRLLQSKPTVHSERQRSCADLRCQLAMDAIEQSAADPSERLVYRIRWPAQGGGQFLARDAGLIPAFNEVAV